MQYNKNNFYIKFKTKTKRILTYRVDSLILSFSLNHKNMRIIKFEANSCHPCSAVGELLSKNKIEHERYNIADNVGEFVKFKVRSVPTVIRLNEEGEEIDRVVGFKPEEILKIAQ